MFPKANKLRERQEVDRSDMATQSRSVECMGRQLQLRVVVDGDDDCCCRLAEQAGAGGTQSFRRVVVNTHAVACRIRLNASTESWPILGSRLHPLTVLLHNLYSLLYTLRRANHLPEPRGLTRSYPLPLSGAHNERGSQLTRNNITMDGKDKWLSDTITSCAC